MIDLTEIISAAVLLIVALLSAFLIPLIKHKVNAEKLDEIRVWVEIAVRAAEQIFHGTGLGAEKKEFVMTFLRERGFTLNREALDNIVEAAVLELKNELY